MELIATHIGADFDAFASMSMARRLHPEAQLFFPGSREESVRRMLEESEMVLAEVRQRHIDPATIERLILCDTRQRDRLGVIADWLERYPGIEVLVYDHHSDTDRDLEVAGGVIDPEVGATSTLIVEEIRGRALLIAPDEATLLLLGIYEDTGSLSFPTTSPRDHMAAAWLLEQGGDLALVRRYALHSLDSTHLNVLHRMTREIEVTRVQGHRVGLVALELGRYVDELAPLVSRTLELLELPLLIAFFGEGERVTVIARGELEGFHLGEFLASVVGGGGHATAAAGGVRSATAIEVRERTLAALESHLPPTGTAADLMNHPFVTVPDDVTIEEAKAMLVRARINAAPVGANGRIVGAVTRQILDAALQHGLGQRPVGTAMSQEVAWVDRETQAEELARLIAELHPRFLLVGDEDLGEAEGLVTRMNVLRHLYSRLAGAGEVVDRRTRERRERRRGSGQLVRDRLPDELQKRVEIVASVARSTGASVFLVGGFVRDLLLGRENRDLDIVVRGDGPEFARALADAIEGKVRVHEPFMTAVVTAADGFVIDVATARSEFYRAPAALPEVRTSALRQDLYRRDFTINTLALEIGPEPRYELVDFFGGQDDLRHGVIRVIHSLSFIDDPTRVLRAVRLELRLGFTISPETLRLIGVAMEEGVFAHLSGSRLREELRLLLDDPDTGVRGLERLDELGVLAVLHPDLRLNEERVHLLREARSAWSWYRLQGLEDPPVRLSRVMILTLAIFLDEAGRLELADRLELPGNDRRQIAALRPTMRGVREVLARPDVAPHQAHGALARLDGDETLLLMAIGTENEKAWVRRDLEEMRAQRLSIGGGDLLSRGYEPGPWIGRSLAATLDARLDGAIDAADELDFADRWLRSRPAEELDADRDR